MVLIPVMLFWFVSSCVVYHPQERPKDFLHLPPTFTLYEDGPVSFSRWWQAFNSDELNRLVETALHDSPTMAEIDARIEQALAAAVKKGAARRPGVDAGANASVSRSRKADPLGETTDRYHGLNLTAGYEPDFRGKIRAVHRSFGLDFKAAEEDRYAALIDLSGRIGVTWFNIITVDRKLAVLKKQRKTNRTMLDLTLFRYQKGQATALDVFQQKQSSARNKSAFPQLEARAATLRHELALLTGRPAPYDFKLSTSNFPVMPKLPKTGIPADLLAARPDIRKAGLKLKSADWLVGAAKADRLPSIRLTASYSYESKRVSRIFNHWAADLAGSIIGPIFDGGARKAEVKRAEALVKERLAAYEKIVLTAVKEVEDALINEKKQADYLSALNEQYKATGDTYKQALEYYRKGSTGYLNVLDSLKALQALALELVDAENRYFQYRIALYQSLGGNKTEQDKIININKGTNR